MITRLKDKQTEAISRRTFCASAITAAVAMYPAKLSAGAAKSKKKVRFFKNLGGGHIGVRTNQQQALEYAVRYGFDGITPSAGAFENKSDSEIRAWVQTMKEKGIRYGASGLPVGYRRDEDRFLADLGRLPKQAGVLKRLGVKRMATWITPGHNELTYLQNFALHKRRLGEAAKVLKDHRIA